MLTTKQHEIMRAINAGDYQYMLDMGVLDEGQDLNFSVSGVGTTPLMLASAIGNILIIDLICKNKEIEVETQDKNGYNCLYYATYYGRLKVVQHLKEKWCVPYKKSKNGTTCLHVAVRRGHTKLVHFFLKKMKESDR